MSQKLILPINNAKLTASMKTQAYLDKFKFVHYGIDMVSTAGNRTLYASGDGTVVATGRDMVCYPNAFNSITGHTCGIVFRYFHFKHRKMGKQKQTDISGGSIKNSIRIVWGKRCGFGYAVSSFLTSCRLFSKEYRSILIMRQSPPPAPVINLI